jgi:murein L,D-transpeptidase YafK
MRRSRLQKIAMWAGGLAVIGGVGIVLGMNALDPSPPRLPADARADRIVIEKAQHRMSLFANGDLLRSYDIALGYGELGPKMREGDARTPEGLYHIDGRNPRSAFHLSLHISYPSAADKAAAEARGDKPGFDIMIHGIRNGLGWIGPLHRLVDWTAGCAAVTNVEIEEIWRVVPDGTAIEIRS